MDLLGLSVTFVSERGVCKQLKLKQDNRRWKNYNRTVRRRISIIMDVVNGQTGGSNYRWYVLALSSLTFTFGFAMPTMSMPVLFKEISEDLGLDLVQIGWLWGVVPLAGFFVILIGGLLSDRFGTKLVLGLACVLAGFAGAMRGLSDGFFMLVMTMFLFGLLTSVIPTTVHKACGVWFLGRSLGLANGVVSMAMGLGFTAGAMLSATVLSPMLGGWRNVMFLYVAMSAGIGILWLLTRGQPRRGEPLGSYDAQVPLLQALARVIRIKRVWLLGFILLGHMGCVQATLGYLPFYLREIGWPAASADGALASFHWASMMATIPIALLSDKLGSRKPFLLIATMLTAIGIGLLSVADGTMVWVAIIMAGVVRDGFMAVLITMVTETEGVEATYARTATGLAFTLSRVGSFMAPPIGAHLARTGLRLPFVLWASMAAMAFFGYLFIKDAGRRAAIIQ